jgi:predicted RNA-binding Zn ribbon-like protein
MEKVDKSIETLTIDGGWLSLDFVNTVSDRNEIPMFNYLSSYLHVLEWSVRVEILNADEELQLMELAAREPINSTKSWVNILELREMLFRLFQRVLNGNKPDGKDLNLFNKWLSKSLSKNKIEIGILLHIQCSWDIRPGDFDRPLYPIIKSAYDLLLSEKLDRVKECGACGWLFLDKSKNKSRRWCKMDTCGSQEKSKNYYHRKKEQEAKS